MSTTSKTTYFGVIIKDKDTRDLDIAGLKSEFLANSAKEACAVAQYIIEKRKSEIKAANQVIIVYRVKRDEFMVERKYTFP